jgi:hypothetical protein
MLKQGKFVRLIFSRVESFFGPLAKAKQNNSKWLKYNKVVCFSTKSSFCNEKNIFRLKILKNAIFGVMDNFNRASKQKRILEI